MNAAGWYALAWFAVLAVANALAGFYWRGRCAEAEARADERARIIDRLYDDRREAGRRK